MTSVGLALFVVDGMINRYWHPQSIPPLKYPCARLLYGIPKFAEDRNEGYVLLKEDDEHVRAWKECVPSGPWGWCQNTLTNWSKSPPR